MSTSAVAPPFAVLVVVIAVVSGPTVWILTATRGSSFDDSGTGVAWAVFAIMGLALIVLFTPTILSVARGHSPQHPKRVALALAAVLLGHLAVVGVVQASDGNAISVVVIAVIYVLSSVASFRISEVRAGTGNGVRR